MMSTWKGRGWRGVLKIFPMPADSFVFKQKIYCLFLLTKLLIFCGRHKCMTPNALELKPIQSLETVIFSSTSSCKPDTF